MSMKKCTIPFLCTALALGLAGCKSQESSGSVGGNQEISNASNQDIYESIVQANEEYGLTPDDTCQAIFKCDRSDIGEKVILAATWGPEFFKGHVDKIEKISKPNIQGYDVYHLISGKDKITYITAGMGACKLMDVVLALGQTDCKEIVFVDSNGALQEGVQIGDIMVPEYSICGVGSDRYLCTGDLKANDCCGQKYYPDATLLEKAMRIAQSNMNETDFKVHKAQNYCVDTIYAQFVHLDEIVSLGCNSLGMETSTLFHAANLIGIKAVAILPVTDNIAENKTLYSGCTAQDEENCTKVKSKYVPKIILELLRDA